MDARSGIDAEDPPRLAREDPHPILTRLRRKPQLRITVETAEVFGAIAARLKRARRDPNVRINDLWLAAQAIQRNFKLLTSNPRDFKDIPGLKMIALPAP